MRLIGDFEKEKEAYLISSLLLKEGIQNSYETVVNPSTGKTHYRLWIAEEDAFEKAGQIVAEFQKNPNEIQDLPPAKEIWKITPEPKVQAPPFKITLTNITLLLCVILYLWNGIQEARIAKAKETIAVEDGFTSIQKALLFDYPSHFLQPQFNGFCEMLLNWKATGWQYFAKVPLFQKIAQGQVWRLFTPCLLHRDFLHILFNMAWLWYLGRQIEERSGKWKLFCLFLVIGVISNVVQYLVGGPFFLGFSGIIVGMVGYIWMRQKVAPWEGYPLPRVTVLFIVCFVAVMFLLEFVAFILQLTHVSNLSPNIANTAHIVGGITGLLMGKTSLFSREAA